MSHRPNEFSRVWHSVGCLYAVICKLLCFHWRNPAGHLRSIDQIQGADQLTLPASCIKKAISRRVSAQLLLSAGIMAFSWLGAYGQTGCSVDTSIAPADPITSLLADDATDLNGRIPLILIHGINEKANAWDALATYLKGNGIEQHYKIYRFQYDSHQQPTSELGRSLRNRIDELITLFPAADQQMVIIAHSMGGLVSRSFMNEWALTKGTKAGLCGGERVLKLITLATPHHGTPSVNGAIRVPAEFNFNWGDLPGDLDDVIWSHFGCSACSSDLQHPNRADLRYDNSGPLPGWPTNEYVGDEVNTWLLNLKHSYDSKVIAYYGFIGSNADISELGNDLSETLHAKFFFRLGNEDAQLNVLGVLLERINSQTFDSPGIFGLPGLPLHIDTVFNDGVVPIFSGSFDNAIGVKRISCPGYNHNQILQSGDSGSLCISGLRPFPSIIQDLNNAIPPPNSLIVDPAPSWDYQGIVLGNSADKVFTFQNVGSSAFSLTSFNISDANQDQFSIQNPPLLPLGIPSGQTRSITVRFQPTTVGSKSATLTVTTDTFADTVPPITLTGLGTQSSCNATLSATQVEVPSSGGTASFNVSVPSGCPWVVTADPSFITITSPVQGVGFGNGAVSFTLPANSGPLRISHITFSAGVSTQSILVIQDGASLSCSYQLSAASNHVPASGATGAFTIAVAPGCSWMVSSSQPFVTFTSLTSGSGTAGISYSVAPNTIPSIRFSTISITTSNGILTYIVQQDAAVPTNPSPCSYSLSSTGRAYTADAWDDAFIVNTASGCTWSARTADSWITLLTSRSPAAGGSDSVGYQVAPNPGSTLRIATITVVGQNNITLTYTIWQQPPLVGSPQIVLPVTNISLGDVLVNTRVNQTVQIQNKGTKDLAIAAIFELSGSADMFVSSFNPIVVPGGTNTFQVSFIPSTTGRQSGIFRIQTNDPITPTVDITVAGNGVPQGQGGTDFIWTNTAANGPSGLSTNAVATIGNTIYILGPDTLAHSYDPTIAQWTTLPTMPHVTIDPGAAVINGKIYVLGDIVTNQVQIFDPSTQTWALGAALPDSRQSMTVAAAGGKLYAIGGLVLGSVIAKVAVYDPALDQWSSAPDMITARAVASAATVNGRIYVIGGLLDQGVRTGVTEIFDPTTNSWSNREDMPTRRALAGIAVLGTDIYVFGGSGNFGTVNVVEKQDTTAVKDNSVLTQTWTEKNPLQVPRLRDAAAFVNGKAFVFGGTNDSGSVNTNEEGDLIAAPVAGITETSVSFGDVVVGQIGEVAITIANNGNAGLTLSFAFSQPQNEIQLFRAPNSLAAGQSSNLILRLAPTTTGTKSASLTISTNDTAHPTITINMTGAGIPASTPVTGVWKISKTIPMPPQTAPRSMIIVGGNAYVGTIPSGLAAFNLSSGALNFNTAFSQFPSSSTGMPSAELQNIFVPLSNTGASGKIAVVDAQTGSLSPFISAGLQPFGSASNKGIVYITDEVRFSNGQPSPVIAIDAGTKTPIVSIPVGFNPNAIALDSATGKAYVTTFGDEGTPSSGVTIIDTLTNSVIGSVQTRYNPRGIVLSRGRAYIQTDAALEVMDLASNTIVGRVALLPDSQGITENLGQIFILNPTFNRVDVIDTSSLSVVQTLTPGNTPSGVATDPATHIVYVANQGDATLVALESNFATFDMSCSGLTLSVSGKGTSTCTITGKGGFTGLATLSCIDLPGSSNCSFDHATVNVSSTPVVLNVTLQADQNLIAGNYSFTTSAGASTLTRNIAIPFALSPPLAALSVSTLSFGNQLVAGSGSTQTFNIFNNGNAPLSISKIIAPAGYSVPATCVTTLLGGQGCQVSVSFSPSTVGLQVGTLQLFDNAGDSPQSVTLSGNGVDLIMAPSQTGGLSVTVKAGQPAQYNLTLASAGGLTGQVNFSCSGLPAHASCTFTPSSLLLSSTPTGFTVNVSTQSTGSALLSGPAPNNDTLEFFLAFSGLASFSLLGLYGLRAPRFKRLRVAFVFGVLTAIMMLSSCGGGGGSTPPPPAGPVNVLPGTYQLTVNATAGNLSKGITLNLTVQ